MKGIIKGRQGGPRRVLFHGTNWVGKTTFASRAFGGCLLGNFEDDKDANMDKTPALRWWREFIEWFGAGGIVDVAASKNEFPYKWIAIDTIDALQRLIERDICDTKGADSMAADCFSYGKGNKLIESYWGKVKFALDWLHTEHGLGIILLSHSESVKMTPPDAPSYERMEPAVSEFARDMFCDWCQEVFYGSFRTFVATEDAGFNRTRNIAAGGTERVVRCAPTAGVRAKNRLNMPEQMVLTEAFFDEYAAFFIPADVLKKG